MKLKIREFRLISLVLLLLVQSLSYSACKWVWVDDDYDMTTPAVRKQVCDSTMDLPALKDPSLRPLQKPQIKPMESLSLPPLGTSSCRTQSVFENGRWVNKRICN